MSKECACLTHEGPHWLHMDTIWKEQNAKILAQAIIYEDAAMQIRESTETPNRQQRIAFNRWVAYRDNQMQCYLREEIARLTAAEHEIKRADAHK